MTAADPSLIAFLLDRLDEETQAIMMYLPLPLPEEMHASDDDGFLARLLDRNHLFERVQETKAMVADIVEAMEAEQGAMLIHNPENVPVAQLGSRLIKMWAARYADHPE